MHTGKELAERAARDLAASSKTSPTAAGPNETERRNPAQTIDAINQVFTLFRLNYHNQYYSAYPDAEQLNQIKKLWLDSLAAFSTATILLGARHCIQTSQYLPTLHRMLEGCQEMQMRDHGLPDAHTAYLEACLAPEPKHLQRWSHVAVYHAGRDTGWYTLASSSETRAFPQFERHYQAVCARVTRGEELYLPPPTSDSAGAGPALSIDEQRQRLRKLRESVGI